MNLLRNPTEHHFHTHDGESIFYRHWPADPGARRGAIALFHRTDEQGARMAHLVDELDLAQFDFFAWDARGHGRSLGAGRRGTGFATSVRDVQTFVEHLARTHGTAADDLHAVAQGTSAVQLATWAHDYAPRTKGMTLVAPAFELRRSLAFARTRLSLLQRLQRLHGPHPVDSPARPRHLTDDAARITSRQGDPPISRSIALDELRAMQAAADRVVADAVAIEQPVLLLIPDKDRVVEQPPQHRFFERLGSAVKRKLLLPGFLHDALGERDRAAAVKAVRAFVIELFEGPLPAGAMPDAQPDVPSNGAASQASNGAPESPASPASPAPRASHAAPSALRAPSGSGLGAAATRMVIRMGARLSHGIALGHRTGFASARALDHVYLNRPEGTGALGRRIDAAWLDSIGARGLRLRKLHVEELLREAMEHVAERHRDVRIMDIAAGHGRCVLDAVAASPIKVSSILLRDSSEADVREGRALIAERGLEDTARFVQADAFDRSSLARVIPRPTVALAFGLYEQVPDSEPVARSLAGVGDAVEDGGYLVYTGQPTTRPPTMLGQAFGAWHQGDDASTPRRTQAELDRLVEAAGFRKLTQRIDPWGLFTVSLAIRTGH